MAFQYNGGIANLNALLPSRYYMGRPPLPGDDDTQGYKPGDTWVDTTTCTVVPASAGAACSCEIYTLHDSTAGAAKWYSDESKITALDRVCDLDMDTCFQTGDGADNDRATVVSQGGVVQTWMPNLDTILHNYPNFRDDGATRTVLYTDKSGRVLHGPIGGMSPYLEPKKITSAPTSVTANQAIGHWYWNVNTAAADVDLSVLNTVPVANVEDGDELTFYSTGGGKLSYTFPVTGLTYEFCEGEFITLRWDEANSRYLLS